MIMTSFLKTRKSVREFKRKKAREVTLNNIKSYLQDLEKEDVTESIKFDLYENGSNLYKSLKGLGGYAGTMIESPHYISLRLMNQEEKTIINGAYLMEKLISKVNNLGLDTCWVSIVDVEESDKIEALGEKVGKVDYLLAIGYSKPRNPFVGESVSERIGVEELVYSEKIGNPADLEELDNRGLSDLFYYVRFAPSAKNNQPWRFLLNDNKAILLLEDMDCKELSLTDAGIIMYYFESLASSIGINSEWKLLGEDYQTGNPSYKAIAEITL